MKKLSHSTIFAMQDSAAELENGYVLCGKKGAEEEAPYLLLLLNAEGEMIGEQALDTGNGETIVYPDFEANHAGDVYVWRALK